MSPETQNDGISNEKTDVVSFKHSQLLLDRGSFFTPYPSGHMEWRVGRCSVWVAVPILVLRITRYSSTSPLEGDSTSQLSVLTNCESLVYT